MNTTLTAKEKSQLKEKGYSTSDLNEITRGIKITKYILILEKKTKEISEEEAIKRLGREEWLKGIAKSSFNMESIREGLKGERIMLKTKLYRD